MLNIIIHQLKKKLLIIIINHKKFYYCYISRVVFIMKVIEKKTFSLKIKKFNNININYLFK